MKQETKRKTPVERTENNKKETKRNKLVNFNEQQENESTCLMQ